MHTDWENPRWAYLINMIRLSSPSIICYGFAPHTIDPAVCDVMDATASRSGAPKELAMFIYSATCSFNISRWFSYCSCFTFLIRQKNYTTHAWSVELQVYFVCGLLALSCLFIGQIVGCCWFFIMCGVFFLNASVALYDHEMSVSFESQVVFVFSQSHQSTRNAGAINWDNITIGVTEEWWKYAYCILSLYI